MSENIDKLLKEFKDSIDAKFATMDKKIDSLAPKKETKKEDNIFTADLIKSRLDAVPIPTEWKDKLTTDGKCLAIKIHEEMSKNDAVGTDIPLDKKDAKDIEDQLFQVKVVEG